MENFIEEARQRVIQKRYRRLELMGMGFTYEEAVLMVTREYLEKIN